MTERTFAEIFPPGEFIHEELEARGWSQVVLADILGRTPAFVNELIMAKRGITPETALALADAFGTSAQYWMNLDTAYQLWKAKGTDNAISRRARLYKFAPIKEMVRRHWIEPSENIEVLEKQVLKFFNRKTFDEQLPEMSHAARKSTSYHDVTPAQEAWLLRAKQLAHTVPCKAVSKGSLDEGLGQLQKLLISVQEIRRVPRILTDMGIRFLVIEPLPQTRIDGACFWLDQHSPVIVLSLRFDRVDAFWYTLAHELGHVLHRDGLHSFLLPDINLVNDQQPDASAKPPIEQKADEFAAEFLVPRNELKDFIVRTAPLYSRSKIVRFAKRIKVHEGIIVGQLQYRKELTYAQYRRTLEKVRHVITQSALTDGWGHTPPANL